MKWAIAAVTLVHGLIHLMGFVDGLGIKTMAQLTNKTIFALSPIAKTILAYVWLLALVAFLVMIGGLIFDKSWWKIAALMGVAISQILIIIWWKDAWAGTIINIIIVAAVIFYHSLK